MAKDASTCLSTVGTHFVPGDAEGSLAEPSRHRAPGLKVYKYRIKPMSTIYDLCRCLIKSNIFFKLIFIVSFDPFSLTV